MGWPYHNKPPMGWPLDYDSGLVPDAGFWPMSEGSGNKVLDLSGNGNDGTISGATWQPEKFGSGLNFVAGTNVLTVPHSESLNFDGFTDSYTIIVWAKGGSQIGDGFRLMEKHAASGKYSVSLQGAAGTGMLGYIYDGANLPSVNFGTCWDNVWHQFAFVVDNGADYLYAYKDGILVDSTVNSTTGTTANTETIYIGNRSDNERDFIGDIDHIIIYNRALSSEIALLRREPFCMFMNPDEVPLLDQYYTVTEGGIMTPNTRYWGAL